MTTPDKSKNPFATWTLALYGLTHSGKSTQWAKVARYIYEQSGLKTRVYLTDLGDLPAEADALLAAGIAEKIDLNGIPHPYYAAPRIAQGMVPELNGKTMRLGQGNMAIEVPDGSWKASPLTGFGLVVVDSGTGLADNMFADLSQKSALGINIGGEGAMNFMDGGGSWGQVSVGSSNKAHYNVVQTQMHLTIGRLKSLAVRENLMVIMTFGEDRGEQESNKIALIGPKTKGSAQTALLPGWFKFTYRLQTVPTAANKEGAHKLWTAEHQEAGVKCLANRRFPSGLGAAAAEKYPIMIEPADVVQALKAYQDVTRVVGGK